jgi:signal transduction histidine kinase
MLDQIEGQLRRLSHELRPTILDDLGLLPALRFLAQGVSTRAGIPIKVESSMEDRLPSHIETALYRTVQEALNNATKHAQPKRVTVKLERQGKIIQCSVRDDGIGFDVPTVLGKRGRGGIGLIGIQERLNAIGGTKLITSSPGQGTELLVAVPLEK